MKELLLILLLYIIGASSISAGFYLILGLGPCLIVGGIFIIIFATMLARGITSG